MNSNKITIDILMATYNGENYLVEQIESILNQTYQHFNLIIADDCSTDNTRKLLANYAEKDQRIRVITNKKNLGVIKNFEYLLMISDSPYFMLSDQDDVWHPYKVEKSLQAILQSKVLLMYSDLKVVNSELELIHHSFWESQKIKPVRGNSWKKLIVQNIVTGCTIIAKHELRELSIPFPNEIEMHDSWLSFVASLSGGVDYINEPLLMYRQHEANYIGALDNSNRTIYHTSNYSSFLERRKKLLNQKSTLFSSYIGKFNVDNIDEEINKLLKLHKMAADVKYIRFSFKFLKIKLLFPNQSLRRNIWWILYFQFPIVNYLLIKFKKLLYFSS